MPTFKITVSYDGTGFVGWQRQAEGTSIQGLLEAAFGALDGREVAVAGASRTDAGVHARGQVASVFLQRTIDPRSLAPAINTRLPPSVRLLEAVEVPESFHARFDARAKTYRYRIWNADVISPFERLYAWHVPAPALDLAAMDAAARLLEGRHDFAAFESARSATHSSERVVFTSRVWRESEHVIACEIRGDGFLRHMVRTVAGSLVDVGRGRRPPAWMAEVLASCDRQRAGRTAPAEGLFLMRVEYDDAPEPHPESSS